MSSNRFIMKRRTFIRGAALAGLAAPALWGTKGYAADEIVVADSGGATSEAMRKAYYEPFEKETGVKVVVVAHEPDPTTQMKVFVDTKNPVWDLVFTWPTTLAYFDDPLAYFEPLELKDEDVADIIPAAKRPYWLGCSVFASVLAYRTDTFPDKGPNSWADFWNTEGFAGRRGLFKDIDGPLEQALFADGMTVDDIYPLDDEKVERGFKALERIKPHINVWWNSGAQLTQILQSGEVDMAGTWSSRAYAATAAGAPVKLVWNQGTYNIDGWVILKGSKKLELARQFVRFCTDPKRQAVFSNNVLNGPTNSKAFADIAPERASILPTAPDNLKLMAFEDSAFWAKNKAKLSERYLAWILE